MPQIKKQVEQAVEVAQESMSKIDMKSVSNKVQQAVQIVKKKIDNLKKSSKNNELAITVNNEEAKKQISQLEKEIESLQQKINARQLKLNITNDTIDKIKAETNQQVIKEMPNAGNKAIKQETYKRLDNDENYSSLVKESDKLNNEVMKYNSLLETSKSKMSELKQETTQTSSNQNKLSTNFGGFKGKIQQAKTGIDAIRNLFSKMPNITKTITNNIKKMSTGIKTGLGHVLKYAGALFGIRSIYNTLKSSAQSWLSSQNSQAQQLSANIEYMKYSMGSVFAPVIEYITNLVYNLMKAIQSVVYAFSGINIFAKATASSMGKTAKSAKETNKSLSGIHGEINNVSENKDNGDGSGAISPSMDLSQVDTQMSSFGQKLYDFFSPLVESWNTYGTGLIEQVKTTAGQIGGLIASVWGSFENIIVNGTVYSILQNILAIIGNIAEAFANAWNYNGNGDAIVQNLANAFNNLLTIINNIVSSDLFQWLLNIAIEGIKIVTDAIKELTDAVLWVTEKIGEFIGFFTGENSEKLDGWAIIIGSIATAIGLVVAAVTAWNIISAIATVATTAFGIAVNILTAPITLVILAIAALIAIIVSIVVYWDEISAALATGWEWIKQKATEIFTAIGDFFKNIWEWIRNKVTEIVTNWINDQIAKFEFVKGIIVTVFTKIKDFFVNIWNTISNVVTNIWNNIWNGIKKVINFILGGIENFVNGTIKGINKLLSGISSVANAVGSLIGLDPINLQINTISLPRLAKGNVAYSPLIAQFGEYAGASTNPEITAPQNILRETFDDVLSSHEWNNNGNSPIQLAVYVGNKKLGEILLEDLRNMKRQTGKDIEALAN